MSVSVLPPSVDFQTSIASRNSASGLFGSTARPMSYHIWGVSSPHGPAVTVPPRKSIVDRSATFVQLVPPFSVRQSPRKHPRAVPEPSAWRAPQFSCGSTACTSAYRTCGSLGAIAISIRPSLFAFAAQSCVVSGTIGGSQPTPPAVPAGQPFVSAAQDPAAGQPLAGIAPSLYTPFAPFLPRFCWTYVP